MLKFLKGFISGVSPGTPSEGIIPGISPGMPSREGTFGGVLERSSGEIP